MKCIKQLISPILFTTNLMASTSTDTPMIGTVERGVEVLHESSSDSTRTRSRKTIGTLDAIELRARNIIGVKVDKYGRCTGYKYGKPLTWKLEELLYHNEVTEKDGSTSVIHKFLKHPPKSWEAKISKAVKLRPIPLEEIGTYAYELQIGSMFQMLFQHQRVFHVDDDTALYDSLLPIITANSEKWLNAVRITTVYNRVGTEQQLSLYGFLGALVNDFRYHVFECEKDKLLDKENPEYVRRGGMVQLGKWRLPFSWDKEDLFRRPAYYLSAETVVPDDQLSKIKRHTFLFYPRADKPIIRANSEQKRRNLKYIYQIYRLETINIEARNQVLWALFRPAFYFGLARIFYIPPAQIHELIISHLRHYGWLDTIPVDQR